MPAEAADGMSYAVELPFAILFLEDGLHVGGNDVPVFRISGTKPFCDSVYCVVRRGDGLSAFPDGDFKCCGYLFFGKYFEKQRSFCGGRVFSSEQFEGKVSEKFFPCSGGVLPVTDNGSGTDGMHLQEGCPDVRHSKGE